MHVNKLLLFVFLGCITLCKAQKTPADLLVYNARIYTVDERFSVKEAMAIKDGHIVDMGTTAQLKNDFNGTQELDAGGKAVYPGFIDAHAHLLAYGLSLHAVNLTGTKSWQECLNKIKAYAAIHKEGWITGRGWDQNDWDLKNFPTKDELDRLFADRPILLERIDGHAAIAYAQGYEKRSYYP